MEKKKKPTLYIRGNVIVDNALAIGGGNLEAFVPEDSVDLSDSVVIDGDVALGGLVVHGGFAATSGEIQKGGSLGS